MLKSFEKVEKMLKNYLNSKKPKNIGKLEKMLKYIEKLSLFIP